MARLVKLMLLATVVMGAAFYIHLRNIAALPVALADLDKGGAFSAEERSTLKAACVARTRTDAERACGCLVDKAGSELSRFDRMVMTATFQQRLADVVALSRGLSQSGVARAQLKSVETDSRARVRDVMKACNAE